MDKESLENTILSCARAMAGMASETAAKKKQEWAQTAAAEEEIKMMEAEKGRLSARKLSLYEEYRLGRITKEQYRREYESTADRILEIEKKIPELREEVMQIREQVQHMQERETEMEGLASLETFDKDKLSVVIDRVFVYSKERIEIVWKIHSFGIG